MEDSGRDHRPVLLNELVDVLDLAQANTVIDATVGFGGHARAVLDELGPPGRLVGLERDPEIYDRVQSRFQDDRRVTIRNENYCRIGMVAEALERTVDAVYFDLGVNSFHFDSSSRGFSFNRESDELDMRFNPDGSAPSAREWINSVDSDRINDTLRRNGEVRASATIAEEICSRRPLTTVGDLRDAVEAVVPPPYRQGELARVFQAIRIEVNDELQHLEDALEQTLDLLEAGGRMAVISFHSLEDRTVKQFFRHEEKSCVCPPELPVCACDKEQTLTVHDRSPITPGKEEIEANSRARSAIMRIATKT